MDAAQLHQYLQDRVRRISEYDLPDQAKRLEEVGGPGVGGTELECAPNYVHQADTKDEYVGMALEHSIREIWQEASWCYVLGQYRACIVLSAALLEVTLKYELYRSGNPATGTLGSLIQASSKQGFLPEGVLPLAQAINSRRNDIMHANIELERPESLVEHTGDEHEVEPITLPSPNIGPDGWITGSGEVIGISLSKGHPAYSRILEFKRAARANLFDVRTILRHLYPPTSRESTKQPTADQ